LRKNTFKKGTENNREINLTFEFIAPYTPQQNGKIESKFTTLQVKVCTMINSAKLPWSLRNKLWAQCANLTTQLENVIYASESNTTPYDLLHYSQPD
jgi:hypothetical protein